MHSSNIWTTNTCCFSFSLVKKLFLVLTAFIVGSAVYSLHRRAEINLKGPTAHFQDLHIQRSRQMKVIFVKDMNVDNGNLGGCRDWRCAITQQPELLDLSDAVVIEDLNKWPRRWRPQLWQTVVFSLESPTYHFLPEASESTTLPINFTMTYRQDSDFLMPYGYYYEMGLHEQQTVTYRFKHKNKTRTIAWVVSNCNSASQRIAYARQLSRFIAVDVYGRCSSRVECLSSERNATCNAYLEHNYYFYLSFENSVCKDYVTEKFWERVNLDMVQIVLKRAVVEAVAPPHSFIAVDDFNSTAQLADYLKLLIATPRLYAEYFRWKLKYNAVPLEGIVHDQRERNLGFCSLCTALWQGMRKTMSYRELRKWWMDGSQCDNQLVSRILTSG